MVYILTAKTFLICHLWNSISNNMFTSTFFIHFVYLVGFREMALVSGIPWISRGNGKEKEKKDEKSFDSWPFFYINLFALRQGNLRTQCSLTSDTQEDEPNSSFETMFLWNSIKRNLWVFYQVKNKTTVQSKSKGLNVFLKNISLRFKEFDHSSGWTLAARLTHASRAEIEGLLSILAANGWVTSLYLPQNQG